MVLNFSYIALTVYVTIVAEIHRNLNSYVMVIAFSDTFHIAVSARIAYQLRMRNYVQQCQGCQL